MPPPSTEKNNKVVKTTAAQQYVPKGRTKFKKTENKVTTEVPPKIEIAEKEKQPKTTNQKEVNPDRITIKKAIGKSPFELVYGSKARTPINNLLPVYKFIDENNLQMSDLVEERMDMLAELDESREDAHKKNLKLQQKSKYLFDKKTSERKFEINNLVLLWNARAQDKGKHGKFEALWPGPFVVAE
ncbi:uncharacterized protein LOC131037778 [Cryptomeria japonica]|uniref:uncharacterized protein LOC131037778 n=1 Tax=Cryptomeria japonica TaxID=3369 RepID=UPI0027D9DB83|nr:uncharacterized protein LOC131037778 [Cryptomeria japonica]